MRQKVSGKILIEKNVADYYTVLLLLLLITIQYFLGVHSFLTNRGSNYFIVPKVQKLSKLRECFLNARSSSTSMAVPTEWK